MNQTIKRILDTINKGENILIITIFLKNVLIMTDINIDDYIIQNVKNSLHFISMNKTNFDLTESAMIDINLILSNIKKRNF